MVRPSGVQRFLAQRWPWTLAFWGGSLYAGILFVTRGDADHAECGTIVMGAACGVVSTWVFLRALWHILARINGAPFRNGDVVQIRVGEHRGRVATVYEEWKQRGEVRVDLGERAKKDLKDVFSYVELCRESQAGLVSPSNRVEHDGRICRS